MPCDILAFMLLTIALKMFLLRCTWFRIFDVKQMWSNRQEITTRQQKGHVSLRGCVHGSSCVRTSRFRKLDLTLDWNNWIVWNCLTTDTNSWGEVEDRGGPEREGQKRTRLRNRGIWLRRTGIRDRGTSKRPPQWTASMTAPRLTTRTLAQCCCTGAGPGYSTARFYHF